MTHAKEPFGAHTEPSEAIVNLLEWMSDRKCCKLGGKELYPKKYCSEGGRVVRNARRALWLILHGGV